jgi:hypothetical protein
MSNVHHYKGYSNFDLLSKFINFGVDGVTIIHGAKVVLLDVGYVQKVTHPQAP